MSNGREFEMHNPPHPGEVLKELWLEPTGLSVAEFAKKLDVKRQTLYNVLNGKSAITPNMALRLSKALGTSPDVWIDMQVQYDLWQAKQTINLDNVEVIKRNEAA